MGCVLAGKSSCCATNRKTEHPMKKWMLGLILSFGGSELPLRKRKMRYNAHHYVLLNIGNIGLGVARQIGIC